MGHNDDLALGLAGQIRQPVGDASMDLFVGLAAGRGELPILARKDVRVLGGETYEDVHARVADWLSSLPAEPERKVIVVSHGGSGRVVRGAYLGLSRAETWAQDVPQDAVFRLASGAVARFDCEPAER